MFPDDNTPEEWHPVVGYEGWYAISNRGRVRRERSGPSTYAGYILQAGANRGGYLTLYLTRHGVHHTIQIHVVVAAAFIGPRPSGYEINHRNGCKTDNRADNLEYTTKQGNMEHAGGLGLLIQGDQHPLRRHPEQSYFAKHPELNRGSRHGRARLTDRDVLTIRELHTTGDWTYKALGQRFDIAPSTIWKIIHGLAWRHL